MNIDRIDHLVLTVRNVARTCEFYERVLGMKVVTFGADGGRKALQFGRSSKINLHEYGREFDPHAENPTPGSADLCLITNDTIESVAEHLRACRVSIVLGPVARAGAVGPMMSVYFRDPDLNLIEVSTY
jgi:catechol 2,3-dioxygenase-like lactoylglutathione lyase family enzyme